MKLVAVSDIHGNIKLAKEAVRLANKNMCPILCAGDVLNWDNKKQDKFFIKVLNVFSKNKKKVYMIPGSHEDLHLFFNEYNQKYIRKVKNKYEEHIVRLQVGLFNLGSHLLAMYGGSDSIVDKIKNKTYNRSNFRRDFFLLSSLLNQKKPVILMTHIPPRTYLDMACYKIISKYKIVTRLASASPDDSNAIREHVGNKRYKQLIEAYKPMLCIFGHMHESAGSEELLTHKKTDRSSHLLLNTSKKVHLIALNKNYAKILI